MTNINIGIDIGGHHAGIGIVNDDGEIEKKEIIDYEIDNFNLEDVFYKINKFINTAQEYYDIKAIGIGIPGIATDTYVEYVCNLPISKIELKDYIKTNLPIYVLNDAKCATIAEYQYVDNKFYSNYAFVTIGTGIGCGVIINGKLYAGTTGSASEIGHTVIEKDGLLCRCGRRGCFEQYASVSALKRMTNLDDLDEIFYLAERNEKIQKVVDEYIDNLSIGLANLVDMYDVEILVLGGSLAKYSKEVLHKLKAKVKSQIYNKCTSDFEIRMASLGNDAGIIGASLAEQFTL